MNGNLAGKQENITTDLDIKNKILPGSKKWKYIYMYSINCRVVGKSKGEGKLEEYRCKVQGENQEY